MARDLYFNLAPQKAHNKSSHSMQIQMDKRNAIRILKIIIGVKVFS